MPQQPGVGDRLSGAAVAQGLRQHLHVLQAQVQTLSGQGMHAVGGVADQHQRVGDGLARELAAQRPAGRGPRGLQRTDVACPQRGQSRGDLLRQRLGRQGEQVLCQRLRGGPHQRHHESPVQRSERQQGDHPVRCECLECRAAVWLGADEIRHHAALCIVARFDGNARGLPHPAVLAVRADQQRGVDAAAIIGLHLPRRAAKPALHAGGGRRIELHPALETQRQIEGGFDGIRLDDPRQRLNPRPIRAELEFGAIGLDAHGIDRLDARSGNLRPDAQRVEQLP
ncbi:hypothetical protein GALL_439790 [mine drainage metagenome]|uniref:Uncharacterized protein n=1 Tax=mine drainage metagenome TaxID=410659 RepID=A0A1J5QA46_9ZZZZ